MAGYVSGTDVLPSSMSVVSGLNPVRSLGIVPSVYSWLPPALFRAPWGGRIFPGFVESPKASPLPESRID